MNTNYNRIKVSDLETSAPSKILITNNKGELEFEDFNILGLEAVNIQKENFEFTGSKIFPLSKSAVNVLSVVVDGITLNGTSGAPLQYRMNTPSTLEILDEMVLGEDFWVGITYNYRGVENNEGPIDLSLKQDISNQINVSLPATVQDTWHGKTVKFTGTGTLTIPNTFANSGMCFEGITKIGTSLSWAITAPKTFEFGTPPAVAEKQIFTFMQNEGQNSIMILGL